MTTKNYYKLVKTIRKEIIKSFEKWEIIYDELIEFNEKKNKCMFCGYKNDSGMHKLSCIIVLLEEVNGFCDTLSYLEGKK